MISGSSRKAGGRGAASRGAAAAGGGAPIPSSGGWGGHVVSGLRPDHGGALLNLGAALLAEGQAQEAERCARRLLALRPDDPQALNNLGLALMAERRMPEAEAAFRRAGDRKSVG